MRKHLLIAAAAALAALAAYAQEGMDYCAEGFVKTNRDDDGIVTRAEVTEASGEEFAALDTDGDGTVTLTEFTTCRLQPNPQSAPT